MLYIGCPAPDHTFTIGRRVVENVDFVRNLGVLIDSNLNFPVHIAKVVSKAHARACLIHKCFLSRDSATLVRAFVTYVRPLLEYCSSVWSPHLKRDISKVELVQMRQSKRLNGLTSLISSKVVCCGT